ncbi:MAG: D-aminoacyl-tRNA deacylase [Thermoplasmata archaeon]
MWQFVEEPERRFGNVVGTPESLTNAHKGRGRCIKNSADSRVAMFRYLLVASIEDPVARAVWEYWNPRDLTGLHVAGNPIYQLSPAAAAVQRPGHHVADDTLDSCLPCPVLSNKIPIVFPSIHQSEQQIPCFTVHPLGNTGNEADVGGRPASLVPAPARLMVNALRQLAEAKDTTGLPATYEATHHGPWLRNPAFFAEIGFDLTKGPPTEAVEVLARTLLTLNENSEDRVVVGVGGGHYVPHFTDLALRRQWAFGHLISRHALETLDSTVARQAIDQTPACEGVLFARAEDSRSPMWQGVGARLRDQDAPRRG